MTHNRRLVLGAVALVKARVRGDVQAMSEVRDALESVLIDSGWFPKAPFRWVGVIFRYGSKTESAPHFQAIDDGELPIAIEIDTNMLLEIQKDKARLTRFIKGVTVDCLLAVGEKYELPNTKLLAEKQQPNTYEAPARQGQQKISDEGNSSSR